MSARKPYPSDVSDDEWALVVSYLTLLAEDAGQREYSLREAFNGLRYILKTGAPWRWMPNDLPPWAAVHQQLQRWLAAGCFDALTDGLQAVLRLAVGVPPRREPLSWTAAPCAPPRSSANGPVTTAPSASAAPSCIWW